MDNNDEIMDLLVEREMHQEKIAEINQRIGKLVLDARMKLSYEKLARMPKYAPEGNGGVFWGADHTAEDRT